MPDTTPVPSTSQMGSQELTEEIIRIRAYQLFEMRGQEHGHDMEDWLQAEAEVMGKKKPSASEKPDSEEDSGMTAA